MTQPGHAGVGLRLLIVCYLASKYEVPTVCRPWNSLEGTKTRKMVFTLGRRRGRVSVVFELLTLHRSVSCEAWG